MKPIRIEEVGYTPGIVLDARRNIFQMTGKACPEDAIEFYQPVVNWLEEYQKNPNSKTLFEFKLSYYNTASSKVLLNIMQHLEQLKKGGADVSINWYYYEDDEELQNAGEEFAEMINVPFKIIEIE